jgi:hypothetical protein
MSNRVLLLLLGFQLFAAGCGTADGVDSRTTIDRNRGAKMDASPAADSGPSPDPDGGAREAGATFVGADCLPSGDASVPPGVGMALVADSQSGFSKTQGQCSWSYGYETPDDPRFRRMKDWDEADGKWLVARNVYWTAISAADEHPNGTVTSSGRTAAEQWSVRRWTSTVSGALTISCAARKSAVGIGGNGVDLRVLVDGENAQAEFLGGDDAVGTSFDVPVTVGVGSTVDLLVDPHESDDLYDATIFTAQIWR